MATILVAGSDWNNVNAVRAVAEGEGHTVITAQDGQTAYESAITDFPDLVVLEAAMPIFNGLETCEKIRTDPRVPPTMPIILISDNVTDPRALETAGFSEHITTSEVTLRMRDLLVDHLGYKAVVEKKKEDS